MAECTLKISFVSLLILSVLWLVVGIIFIGIHKSMIRSRIEKEVVIKSESSHYKDWITPPAPVYMEFFIFNVTNYQELLSNPRAVVELQQLGPYTYREHKQKRNITFSDDGEQVSYRENKFYEFMPTLSRGSPKDMINTLNLGYVGISSRFRFSPGWVRRLIDMATKFAKDHSLFMQLPVEDLIWGYKDPLLKAVRERASKYLKMKVNDVVGLFAGKNNTDDGEYTIYTGKNQVYSLGKIITWKNESSLNFWTDEYGNAINGSDGTIYPPFVDTDNDIYFFSSDICRSLYASFESNQYLYDIKMRRFVPPLRAFEKYPDNADNRPFCTPDTKHCLPSGLLNLTSCLDQPIVSSLPHFYQGSPDLLKKFSGLKPNKLEHETRIDVEPMTGTVLQAAKRLQINMFVEAVPNFTQLNGWSPVYFPLAWINESAAMTASLARDLRHELILPVKVANIIPYVLLAVGATLLVAALALGVILYFRKPSDYTRLEEPNEASHLLPEVIDDM